MTVLTQLLLVCVCACALGTPLRELQQHRSDYGVYAGKYARDYEPSLYAAIPLHGPVPLLHVVSRRPLTRAPSVHHPVYARPPYRDNDYAPSAHSEYDYTSYGDSEPAGYGESYSYAAYPPQYAAHQSQYTAHQSQYAVHQSQYAGHQPQYSAHQPQYAAHQPQYAASASASEDEVTILYARPNAVGGYSYRRRPAGSAPKRVPATTESPVVIRVHKYKLVKDLR